MDIENTTMLLRRAFAGESFTLDSDRYSLHDLTQVALSLRPDANLAIRHADHMSPIERASIESAGDGRVIFL